ncbi:MAG: hypothetical protein WC462_02250 [archaeon]
MVRIQKYKAKVLEDKLALRKMIQIDSEIKKGKQKVFSEKEVKKVNCLS